MSCETCKRCHVDVTNEAQWIYCEHCGTALEASLERDPRLAFLMMLADNLDEHAVERWPNAVAPRRSIRGAVARFDEITGAYGREMPSFTDYDRRPGVALSTGKPALIGVSRAGEPEHYCPSEIASMILAVFAPASSWSMRSQRVPVAAGADSTLLVDPLVIFPGASVVVDGVESLVVVTAFVSPSLARPVGQAHSRGLSSVPFPNPRWIGR